MLHSKEVYAEILRYSSMKGEKLYKINLEVILGKL